MSNPCHSKAARTRKVTIVKNYLWQWEPQDGRGNWQTPRWPMNSYRARPAEGNYHFWIPLGRFAQYQNSPTIQEVLGDSARDRLGVVRGIP
ncbi:hypothetical protein OE88DRAFT_1666347 [Heliocybe sulcata]|uniref:Uncharacterized protein n=1 Tax=Heliocybe sulcata TaxID=5364 RepID=A0A5C3MQD2_9AGAM|nr:hypothetical protein OE88DRAFT_1666347 [Heliocybe sulcata]